MSEVRRTDIEGDGRPWTIAEAKARLSQILRLVDEDGPQRIGVKRQYVVIPAEAWDRCLAPQEEETEVPLGRFIVERFKGVGPIELPDREETSDREIPFPADEVDS